MDTGVLCPLESLAPQEGEVLRESGDEDGG